MVFQQAEKISTLSNIWDYRVFSFYSAPPLGASFLAPLP